MAHNLVMFNKFTIIEGVQYGPGQAIRFDQTEHYDAVVARITNDEGIPTASEIENHVAIQAHVPAEGHGPELVPVPAESYGDATPEPAPVEPPAEPPAEG